jgi:hypothetical protein
MDQAIAQLSRQVRQLQRYAIVTTLGLLTFGILGFRGRSSADEVLRVRGPCGYPCDRGRRSATARSAVTNRSRTGDLSPLFQTADNSMSTERSGTRR